MRRLLANMLVALTAIAGLFAASMSLADSEKNTIPQSIELPREVASLRFSKLPGYELATTKCTICHSVDYISYQPPERNLNQWTGEVRKMHDAYGAPISDTDIAQIGAYLAVAYGTAKNTDADVQAASAKPKASEEAHTATGDVVDVNALLSANACLGCHAVDHKVLGPAFQSIAAKYAGDAKAVSAVANSIRAGGVGKWGQIPMPPISGLSDVQAQALAEYILHSN